MRSVALLAALAAGALLVLPAKAEQVANLPEKSAANLAPEPAPSSAPRSGEPTASPLVPSASMRDPAEAGAKPAEPKEPATAEVEKPKPKPITLIAKVNLATQRLHVIENGSPKQTWVISSGAPGFRTPTGTFRAQWTAKIWHSRQYDMAPMPHSVFFKDGAAIHATGSTEWLGQPASHGCVRLAPANAEVFYNLVQKHGVQQTQIQVFGTPPPPAAPRVARRLPDSRLAAYGVNRNGLMYLPPGSPHAGQSSFVHNGVTYIRVR